MAVQYTLCDAGWISSTASSLAPELPSGSRFHGQLPAQAVVVSQTWAFSALGQVGTWCFPGASRLCARDD